MNVKSVVKVMNFHSLLRVNNARSKAELAYRYEAELKKIIVSIINNRIFKQEKISIEMPDVQKELNIYIGSDFGFCANFNTDIIAGLKQDEAYNDKIIVGKKININVDNVILYMDKNDFLNNDKKIYDLVLEGVISKKYSKINFVYIHYYNLNKQEYIKKTILPVDFNSDSEDISTLKEIDYVVEGDLEFIIWSLISNYVSNEIKIAECWSWASENVKRQLFTSESLKKIEEIEAEKSFIEKKEKRYKDFKNVIESNNNKNNRIVKEDG